MRAKYLGDWLVYLVFRGFICVVQAMRIETCAAMARGLAVLLTDVVRIRASVIDENLKQAYPGWSVAERRTVARRMWEHFCLMICEIAHVPRKIHETNWRQYVTLSGAAQHVRLLLDPRPVVMVSGHFGNFEVGGYMAGLYGFPTFTVARPLDNRFLDRFLHRFREATGQYILPKQNSANQIAAVLEKGQTLAFLGDQHAGPKGCWVDFFGRPASCHKAIAVFSLTSSAPLIVAYAKRGDRPLQFETGVVGVADPAEGGQHTAGVKQLTHWYNGLLEQVVRMAPEQYWWLHRRWKDQPKRRKRTE